jgi:enterochelin esterase family protein
VPASRIDSFEVSSQALAGNALGDPATRRLWVYLPSGYDDGRGRFPVAYLLAGFSKTGVSFLQFEAWEENLQQRMDRLLAEGRIRPMLVVLPDAYTRLGGSQYINSTATGQYQDFLLEVVRWADGNLRTIPHRSARAIVGKSSGGFGAIRAAMDHPSVFGLVADHSGDKYFDGCYGPTLARFSRATAQVDLERAFRDPVGLHPHHTAFFDVMEVLALSACYSPNASSRFGFDLPVDLETGELLQEVWSRWKAHDPITRVDASADALRSLDFVYLDCGRLDEYNMLVGSRLMHRRLEALDIRHTYEEFDDGHFHTSYRYDVSLAAISRSIQHES